MVNTVHVAVYEDLADWEIGHALANLRGGIGQHSPGSFDVRTVGLTAEPVVTMGGLRIVPDMALADLRPADSSMLVLGGSTLWDKGNAEIAGFATKAREFLQVGVPVAAICGAVAGLAREGLLDDRGHTSAVPEYLQATGYAGGALYREGDAATDGDLITAGPTEPVAFAREIFARLGVYKPEALDAWFRLYSRSDVSAYAVLMSA
jgi:putative intracellular protease/amidase